MPRIRIVRKFANALDGIDLSDFHVGGVVDVSDSDARVLIAEGWAQKIDSASNRGPVLIVEDDDDARRMLAECVREQGYSVIEARDGREGIAALVGHRPAVVLLDLKMPRMNGEQFRSAQRSLTDISLTQVPVVVVSGAEDATETAARLGAEGILRKPVDPSELVSVIASNISHTSIG